MWSLQRDEPIFTCSTRHKSFVNDLSRTSRTSGSNLLATASDDCTIKIFDVRAAHDAVHTVYGPSPVVAVSFDSTNTRVWASDLESSSLQRYDLRMVRDENDEFKKLQSKFTFNASSNKKQNRRKRSKIKRLSKTKVSTSDLLLEGGHSSDSVVTGLDCDNNARVCSYGSDGVVNVWNASPFCAAPTRVVWSDRASVRDDAQPSVLRARFGGEHEDLVTAGDASGRVRVWDAETGEIKRDLPGHAGPVTEALLAPGWSSSSSVLVSCASDACVLLGELKL